MSWVVQTGLSGWQGMGNRGDLVLVAADDGAGAPRLHCLEIRSDVFDEAG